jgi:hypothetical protein
MTPNIESIQIYYLRSSIPLPERKKKQKKTKKKTNKQTNQTIRGSCLRQALLDIKINTYYLFINPKIIG